MVRGAVLVTATGLGQPSEHQTQSKKLCLQLTQSTSQGPGIGVCAAWLRQEHKLNLALGPWAEGVWNPDKVAQDNQYLFNHSGLETFPAHWGHFSSEQCSYTSRSEDCRTNTHICLSLRNKHPFQLQISSAVFLTG